MQLEHSWENDGEGWPRIFVPNQIIQLSQACIPLLCFSANIWIALFICRHVWRGIVVHQCLYADKHTLKELVSPRLNLHRVGRWGEQFTHLGECEEARGDQERCSQHPNYSPPATVRKRSNPWGMVKSLMGDDVFVVQPWSKQGVRAGAGQRELHDRLWLRTNSVCTALLLLWPSR